MINPRIYHAFHRRAHELKKELGHGNGVQAWEQTEIEFMTDDKPIYKTYVSFRKSHCEFLARLRSH